MTLLLILDVTNRQEEDGEAHLAGDGERRLGESAFMMQERWLIAAKTRAWSCRNLAMHGVDSNMRSALRTTRPRRDGGDTLTHLGTQLTDPCPALSGGGTVHRQR